MSQTPGFDHMLGACPDMLDLFEKIGKIAPTDLTVLIMGETGTGKELVARSLHRRSTRSKGPFVALNCGALPSSLLESELFGFEKGTFTGAQASHEGHIERAHRGTFFLDEIAEMPLGAQARLLRVLENHRIQRLGAARDKWVDIRVVAATHQDLPALVESRAFRRDLFHRLNEMQLLLPPLRERQGDIRLLAEAYLQRLSKDLGRGFTLTPAAWQLLESFEWPGNIRELENCLHRAAALSDGNTLDAGDLHLEGASGARTLSEVVSLAQEQAVRSSLRRHAGDAAAVAAELEVSLTELQELARRHSITL